ncbi:hypothetical protein AVEN_164507-1 [Araneus ventricosus]|uniref:Uncharacterized protein n=1 Tax=Araneus ventricosus TaxID=182803 RepID=A0A4Y2N627_ARAVE|nr:hypothetical protein AVEN_164507-1 [Araneus ventricosus]
MCPLPPVEGSGSHKFRGSCTPVGIIAKDPIYGEGFLMLVLAENSVCPLPPVEGSGLHMFRGSCTPVGIIVKDSIYGEGFLMLVLAENQEPIYIFKLGMEGRKKAEISWTTFPKETNIYRSEVNSLGRK